MSKLEHSDSDFKDVSQVQAVLSPDDGQFDQTRRDGEAYAEAGIDLRRTLNARVVAMLAITGCIGTGLFLGSGKAVVNGGAVGAVVGYLVVSALICCMMTSLGEMTVHRPHAGSFVAFAADYVDPAWGFATGVIYYLFGSLLPAVEVTAAGILIQYWDPNTSHLPGYLIAMIVFIVAANVIGVKYFGEIEFAFGLIKLTTIVGLIILGLVIDLGGGPNHDRIGFRYWKTLPLNDSYLGLTNVATARFLGMYAVLTQAAFSFGGIESLAFIAGEARNPSKSMARAFRNVYIRIALVYILSVFVISLVIPRNDVQLLGALKGKATAAKSPFVVMINRAGIRVLPHIINAVVFTSALSSGNQGFYVGARTLVAMARARQAPVIFKKTPWNGQPLYAIAVQALFILLSFLSVSNGSNQAFAWLSNLTTLCNLLTWISVSVSYIRFHKACQVQNFDRSTLPFRGYFQPYLAWISLISFSIITLFNGFATFIPTFTASDFVAAYITLPIFIGAYAIYKLVAKTRLVDLNTVELALE